MALFHPSSDCLQWPSELHRLEEGRWHQVHPLLVTHSAWPQWKLFSFTLRKSAKHRPVPQYFCQAADKIIRLNKDQYLCIQSTTTVYEPPSNLLPLEFFTGMLINKVKTKVISQNLQYNQNGYRLKKKSESVKYRSPPGLAWDHFHHHPLCSLMLSTQSLVTFSKPGGRSSF